MLVSKTPWIILLALWMAGATWWHVCRIKQLCRDDGPAEAVVSGDVVRPSLLISDGDRFRLALAGNFSFAKSGANANLNTLMGSLDSLTAYLKAQPSAKLTITGYYAPAETNPTSFANLGLARAEAIKQYLVQQRIPALSLTTNGVVRSDLAFTPAGDSLYGGIGFAFAGTTAAAADTTEMTDITVIGADTTATAISTTPAPVTVDASATEESLAAAERYTSVFEPIDLYFSLSKSDYIKTPETTKFFAEAATYLATHKDKKLRLTGHTDNSGPDDANRRLSRNRANEVKAGLRRSGINQGQIVVDAKGETAPKVPNDTRAGRKANRRVTVVVE